MSEIVLRIARLIVRVDQDELDALARIVALHRDSAVLPRLDVRTMVAPECHDEDRFVLERRERIRFPVHRGKGEVDGRGAERETFVLFEFHRLNRRNQCGPSLSRFADRNVLAATRTSMEVEAQLAQLGVA